MYRGELGSRGKFLVFLAVVAIFAWPGYQAYSAVVATGGTTPSSRAAAQEGPANAQVLPTHAVVEATESTVVPLPTPVPATRQAMVGSTAQVPTQGRVTRLPTTAAARLETRTPVPTVMPTHRPTNTPEEKYPGDSPLETSLIEEWVIRFTNDEREKAGLPPFDHDPKISEIAREHSENMILYGFSHNVSGKDPTDRALDAGYDCRAYHGGGTYSYGLSENIAKHPRVRHWVGTSSGWGGFKYRPTVYYTNAKDAALSLVEGWMNSPGHRTNILDRDSRRIGVGVATEFSDEYGWKLETFYATQNFSSCK